ncbi:MAG: VWA domain-containing protein [Akkermansia sp.]|nr:VWA domain-containing protein [Akkermansia sp.]
MIPAAAIEPSMEATREFTFAQPGWLWLLPALLLFLLLRRRSGTIASLVHPTIRFVSTRLRKPATLAGRAGPVCLVLAMASLIIALARPQWKNQHTEQTVSGIDIMIACDLSGSMASRDMSFTITDEWGRKQRGNIDRLTAAKYVINEFIGGRQNDRIGLVAFAGKAKLCSPLTLDHGIVNYIIQSFYLADHRRPGYIAEDGTAIGTAIASAALRLSERKETKSKVIILVTDGMSNRGSISPVDAARQAAELGIKIFTIAIGNDERLSAYTANVDTFDEKTLREIARITGGQFYRASSGASLQKAFDNIDKLEKTEAKRRTLISYDELFPWALAAGAILLLLGMLLNFARPKPAP